MVFLLPFLLLFAGIGFGEERILICGICKTVSDTLPKTIKNIETLGNCFSDYAVIIYENNSKDDTAEKLLEWAQINPKVAIKSENFPKDALPQSRTERIAQARNRVLEIARSTKYKTYKYLIMVDMDLDCEWPFEEIVTTIHSAIPWDCVSANGLLGGRDYRDRYAFRDKVYPFGPEMLGDNWWEDLNLSWFQVDEAKWRPVFSGFGGLAIYKTATIIRFAYSGTTTQDLENYYRRIILSLPKTHPQLEKYLHLNQLPQNGPIPILFQHNTPLEHTDTYIPVTCCEHVPLHASMAMHGHGKFYINPKLKLYY